MNTLYFFRFALLMLFTISLHAAEEYALLKANLSRALPGQYLVTAQNKNFSVLLIESKENNLLDVHEITVASQKIPREGFSWKYWIENGAPGNTSWLLYRIDIPTGTIQHTYSFTRNEWISIPQAQNFLSTLLNLKFTPIPPMERKKVGHSPALGQPDTRAYWTPPMVVEGKRMSGVPFTAWRTHWPKDGSEMSSRSIEVYIPEESDRYPSYFPYWLQVSGLMGKAKVHIVDSGMSGSPKSPLR
jgi:hypothetical protein